MKKIVQGVIFALAITAVASVAAPAEAHESFDPPKAYCWSEPGYCSNNGVYVHGAMYGCTTDLGGWDQHVELWALEHRGRFRMHFTNPYPAWKPFVSPKYLGYDYFTWAYNEDESDNTVKFWMNTMPRPDYPHPFINRAGADCICECQFGKVVTSRAIFVRDNKGVLRTVWVDLPTDGKQQELWALAA